MVQTNVIRHQGRHIKPYCVTLAVSCRKDVGGAATSVTPFRMGLKEQARCLIRGFAIRRSVRSGSICTLTRGTQSFHSELDSVRGPTPHLVRSRRSPIAVGKAVSRRI